MVVRDATDADVKAVQAIYAHHVLNELASFEETPPDEDEIKHRRAAVLARGFPFLVAELDGQVIGFAFAAPYRHRPAYRYTAENSLYVAPDVRRRGAGRVLLKELIASCTALGLRQMVAVVADSGNAASIRLHESLGFRRAGTLGSVGFKFGRWVDTVLLQLSLGEGDASPPAHR